MIACIHFVSLLVRSITVIDLSHTEPENLTPSNYEEIPQCSFSQTPKSLKKLSKKLRKSGDGLKRKPGRKSKKELAEREAAAAAKALRRKESGMLDGEQAVDEEEQGSAMYLEGVPGSSQHRSPPPLIKTSPSR